MSVVLVYLRGCNLRGFCILGLRKVGSRLRCNIVESGHMRLIRIVIHRLTVSSPRT